MAGMNTRLAKLQMLRENGQNRRREGGDGGRMAYGRDEPWEPDHRRTYTPPYSNPGMTGGDDMDMRRRYQTRSGYEGDMPQDRRMGFGERDGYDAEMRRRRRADGTFMHYGGGDEGSMEPIHFGGMVAMEGGKGKKNMRMTRETAMEWTESLENADPAKPRGAKWNPDQIKPIAQKYGIPTEGERFWEFFAVMNMLYSDYYTVAKKYNALTADFFADMAMAFISDKDAVENKTAVYYECIAQK